jgi:hypothetical protein
MKTAMQELIQELQLINNFKYKGLVIELIKNKLEKEKEQIIDAYTNAYLIGEDDISVEDANKESEEYYNQTYNQKQIIIDIMKADEEDGLYNQNK